MTSAVETALTGPVGQIGAFVWGAIWGSFYNVCIHRIPAGQSVVRPGSRCVSCGAPIRGYDNIPIVSYFLRRGRCRACHAPFSPRYAIVEAATAALTWGLYVRTVVDGPGTFGERLARFGAELVFTGVLVVLSGIDLDTLTLPDRITLPAIPIFLLLGIFLYGTGWADALAGAAVGALLIYAIVYGYRLLAGREGMGEGDAKLLAGIGGFLGLRALPFVLFFASLTGAVVGIAALLAGRGLDPEKHQAAEQAAGGQGEPQGASLARAKVPFGPFLALAAVAYVFVGADLWQLLLSAYG